MEAEETEEEAPPQSCRKLSSPSTMQEDGSGGALDLCPSFSSYSFDGPAETAARVAMEFEGICGDGDCGEENDFEFVLFQKTEDQMIFDCPITPVFPVFNHNLLNKSDELNNGNSPIIRISLQKLIIDDRERERELDRDSPSASSSETDELDGIPSGTYCVWTPKIIQAAEHGKCKKSKSTGSGTGSSSSKRWRLRNLLPRSNSEGGKNLFVFLTPSSKSESTKKKSEKLGEDGKGKKSCSETETNAVARKSKIKGAGSGEKASSAHELFYVRNRMLKEGDKRRSYLPYRQELVGFWANLNTVSKALPPF